MNDSYTYYIVTTWQTCTSNSEMCHICPNLKNVAPFGFEWYDPFTKIPIYSKTTAANITLGTYGTYFALTQLAHYS